MHFIIPLLLSLTSPAHADAVSEKIALEAILANLDQFESKSEDIAVADALTAVVPHRAVARRIGSTTQWYELADDPTPAKQSHSLGDLNWADGFLRLTGPLKLSATEDAHAFEGQRGDGWAFRESRSNLKTERSEAAVDVLQWVKRTYRGRGTWSEEADVLARYGDDGALQFVYMSKPKTYDHEETIIEIHRAGSGMITGWTTITLRTPDEDEAAATRVVRTAAS